jgi:DNA-binding MarR family transcriptional regulator
MGTQRCNTAPGVPDGFELEQLKIKSDRPLGVAYLVGRLDRALKTHFRKALQPLGLTVVQYTALSVFCSSGKISSAKLAEYTLVSPQAANELIKAMEKNGWIERKPDPDHGRIIRISLTQQGMDLLEQCHKVIAVLEREMLSDLCDDEIAQMHHHLRSAMKALRDR